MSVALALDELATELLLQAADEEAGPFLTGDNYDARLGLQSLEWKDVRFVLSTRTNVAVPSRRFLVVPLSPRPSLLTAGFSDSETAFRRVFRAALTQLRPGMFLPPSWAPFHHDRFLIFFASTIGESHRGESARVVLENQPDESPHVLVAYVEESGKSIDLRTFRSDLRARQDFDAFKRALRDPPTIQRPAEEPPHYRAGVELTAPAAKLIAADWTYSKWVEHLSERQREFVLEPVTKPTTVRGAAGTGKTLVLALKAVHDAYLAVSENRNWRCLLLTHNWTSAETVRQTLAQLDEHGVLSGSRSSPAVAVSTLQSFAIDLLQLSSRDVRPLSEDGFEGKQLQLELIEGLVSKFVPSDWAVYKRRCSETFRAGITSNRGTPPALSFCWDLMNEFACVIGAERGLTKESYVSMPRSPWMMDLPETADREVTFLLYSLFRKELHDDLQVLSMFDVTNDLLQYLDSNTWDIARGNQGYDLILVDEFHLFNKQESLVFRYLLRDPSGDARIVAALDPRQSPSETFIGPVMDRRGRLSALLGEQAVDHELDRVYRYSKQIDAVIRALEEHWVFDLGRDFEIPHREVSSDGPVPTCEMEATRERAIDGALSWARDCVKDGLTTAVLCLSREAFALARSAVSKSDQRRCIVLASRDDADAVETWGRRFVLSQPEYVAGLQFDAVVVADASEARIGQIGERPLGRRRVWSNLYLAISRARRFLRFYSSSEEQGHIQLLGPAINKRLIDAS